MALLGATFLPAAYLWIEIGRATAAWLEYPSISLHDPMQLLFLYGEHARLSCAQEPPDKVQEGKQRFADAVAELKDELASYKRIAPRAGAARERRVMEDVGALTVVAAGWGDAAAHTELEHGLRDLVPDYAQQRRTEILEDITARDRERAASVGRFERIKRWMGWIEIGVGVPATVLLFLTRKRRSTHEIGPVPVDVVWGLVLWIWGEAAVKLVAVATRRDVPVLSVLQPFGRLLAIPLVFAVIRSAWGTDTPFEEMRRLPATREGRLGAALWTAVGLALGTATTLGVRAAAKPLGLRRVWSEALMEQLLLGTNWEAAGRVLSTVVGAPVLEEILYRGLLFGGLVGPLGLGWATVVSSLCFTLVHGYGLASSVIVGLHGCIYALVYARTRSLLPSMLLHALGNVAAAWSGYSFLL
jgi:membrane protease YdiL (CAAX protease family)